MAPRNDLDMRAGEQARGCTPSAGVKGCALLRCAAALRLTPAAPVD